jgi:ribose transport system permease protein
MATGAGLLLTDGANIRTGVPDLITMGIGSSKLFGAVPAVAIIAFIIVIIAAFALKGTRFGTHVLGLGSNEKALARCGVPTAALHIKVYAISGACAGLSGIIDLARFTTTTVGGHTSDSLNAITAVVLGGTSLFGGIASIFGTVVGIFVPAILSNGLVMINLQSFWQQIAVGAVLIVAIYIDQGRRNKK